jgi:hypothetical protein
MKKRIISVMAVLAMLLGPIMQSAMAQISIESTKEKKDLNEGAGAEEGGTISLEDLEGDISLENFAPLGGGILVLGCLGGAYLIGKRRKEQKS